MVRLPKSLAVLVLRKCENSENKVGTSNHCQSLVLMMMKITTTTTHALSLYPKDQNEHARTHTTIALFIGRYLHDVSGTTVFWLPIFSRVRVPVWQLFCLSFIIFMQTTVYLNIFYLYKMCFLHAQFKYHIISTCC